MNVLSLFDGISCGQVALGRLGATFDGIVKKYFASEIDNNAIAITQHHYPNTIQVGDVNNLNWDDFSNIDLLIGGSPCQDLCSGGSGRGLDGDRSGLFYKWLDAKNSINPKFWMLENNASMKKQNKELITGLLGVQPYEINSNCVSAQNRKRLYWTNIPFLGIKDKNIYLKDIVEPKENKQNVYDKMIAKKPDTRSYKETWHRIVSLNNKSYPITTVSCLAVQNNSSTKIKYSDTEYYLPSILEAERLQTLPDNYTNVKGVSLTQRFKCVGNGWTVDVISELLKNTIK